MLDYTSRSVLPQQLPNNTGIVDGYTQLAHQCAVEYHAYAIT